ncbi:MAG: hypothetical protein ACMZ64_04805 [Oleiphilus sp.]
MDFHTKLTAVLTLLSLSFFSHSDTNLVFESISELNSAVGSSISGTISNSDNVTILINEIVIHDSYSKEPRLIEITCTLSSHDNEVSTFKTVQKALMEVGENKLTIPDSFNEIISSIPLANIESISLDFELRPIISSNVELFNNISGLLQTALPKYEPIEILRNIFPTPNDSAVKPAHFSASFKVPNNFYHFLKLKDKVKSYPILEPDKSIPLAFSDDEVVLPDGIVKNLGNMIIGSEYFTDTNKVSGYIKITPTKLSPNQLNSKLINTLSDAFDYINSQKPNKLDRAEELISEAETMLDVYYPGVSVQRSNVTMMVQLLRLFSNYETMVNYELFPRFATWVENVSESAALYQIDNAFIKDYYGHGKAAVFFFPILMDNKLVSNSLSMQKRLHNSMKNLDQSKYGYLFDKVSQIIPNTDIAQR